MADYRFVPDDKAIRALTRGADVKRLLERAGAAKAEQVRDRAPKRTGFGASQVDHEVGEDDDGPYARVGLQPDGFYLTFAELGTAHQPATPFMRPALDDDVDL